MMTQLHPLPHRQRLHLQVQGMVQGIGFRPFVYRLATELGLQGWVRNSPCGVEIELEGEPSQLNTCVERLAQEPPPHAKLADLDTQWLPPVGYQRFEIQSSQAEAHAPSAWVLPDLATCPACVQELFDPGDRRYHYPFINCTHCGPRYSILTARPYDRPRTTMRDFCLCPTCQQEYEQPADRRFHAQPNACADCGPHLEVWDRQGQLHSMATVETLIATVAASIQAGEIVAVKGLGGFQLMVDARHEAAVQRLRDRKHRPTKPLAVMYPSLAALQQDCHLSPEEIALLTGAIAPIVLVSHTPESHHALAPSIAPGQSTVGVMLPYTPLHHLLLAECGFPVVATSGNRSQSPICIDNLEAVEQLRSIADWFVVHNRPIARPVDDSVVRVMAAAPVVLRRARGYAPLPLAGDRPAPLPCLLAVGGHQKNTVALSVHNHIIVSQHLGDLSEVATGQRMQATIDQLLQLYDANPVAIACDAHPDYLSTQIARSLGEQRHVPVLPIQHHYAHVLSALVDRGLEPPVLGVAWDGTGYGADGTLWGGEFLAVTSHAGFERVAQLRPFPLPGGEQAVREPRRAALGLLYAALGDRAFEFNTPVLSAFQPQELQPLQTMLRQGINTPLTCSVGRLFAAIAALLNLCQQTTFEGEAAMALEAAATTSRTDARYPYHLELQPNGLIFDWQPMVIAILADIHSLSEQIAAKFHNTLIHALVTIARQMAIPQVVLTGGCFQNHNLVTGALHQLQAAGLQPYAHQQLPPNDGGLSAGQILGAAWQLETPTAGGTPCV